jgi:leucine-zipper of insertion element IS481
MKLHANHRTYPSSRSLICLRVIEDGWTVRAAAEAAGCSARTAAKRLARFRAGDSRLLDRSSRPRHSPARLPHERVEAIERLRRRLRMTAAEIAEVLELPLSRAAAGCGRGRTRSRERRVLVCQHRCQSTTEPHDRRGGGVVGAMRLRLDEDVESTGNTRDRPVPGKLR